MTISFAGVELLLEDPDGMAAAHVQRFLEWPNSIINPPARSIDSKSRVQRPQWPDPPKLLPNQLYWPTGATRWACFIGLATTAGKDAIVAAVGDRSATGTLHISALSAPTVNVVLNNGVDPTNFNMLEAIDVPMYLLPPQPVSLDSKTLWIIPLVDARYWWQTAMMVSSATTWAGLHSEIEDSLGESLQRDDDSALPSDYGVPDPCVFRNGAINAAAALDLYCWATNQRLVTLKLSNEWLLRSQATSKDLYDAERDALVDDTALSIQSTAGGDVADDKEGDVPTDIVFHFTNDALTDILTHHQDIGDAVAWAAGSWLEVMCPAIATGSNDTDLTNMADWWAAGQWDWSRKRFAWSFNGLLNWHLTGYEDYVLIDMARQEWQAPEYGTDPDVMPEPIYNANTFVKSLPPMSFGWDFVPLQFAYGSIRGCGDMMQMIAVTDFVTDFPCTDTMTGNCSPWKRVAASGDSAQTCHETVPKDIPVTQIRASDCGGGAESTSTQEPVLADDKVLAWWNTQAVRWEVVNHVFGRCSYYCGWSPARNGVLDSSTTISGDMALAVTLGSFRQTGTGEAIATATIRLNEFATSRLTIECQPHLPLDSNTGKFWFGLVSGPGVLVDMDAGVLTYITLDSSGAVDVIYNSVPYAPPYGDAGPPSFDIPRALMGWCWLDCDRLTILGYTDQTLSGGRVVTPLAHWPVDQPNVNCELAFGSTVPAGSSGITWDLFAMCSGLCEACSYYSDWPTPGEMDATGIATLTRDSSAPYAVTVPGDLSTNVFTSNAVDPSGVQWIRGGLGCPTCDYISGCFKQPWASDCDVECFNNGTIKVTYSTQVQVFRNQAPKTTAIACVSAGIANNPICYISDTIPVDPVGTWFVVASVRFAVWNIGTDQVHVQQSDGAVYAFTGTLPEDATTTSFTQVAVWQTETNWASSSNFSGATPCPDIDSFIDPGSWPDAIDVAWVPTAPDCGSGPPTTTTSTTTDTTTTTTTGSTTTDTTTTTTTTGSTTDTTTTTTTTTTGSTTDTTTTTTTTTTGSTSSTTSDCTGLCHYTCPAGVYVPSTNDCSAGCDCSEFSLAGQPCTIGDNSAQSICT